MVQQVSVGAEQDAHRPLDAPRHLARMVADIFDSSVVSVALLDARSGDLLTQHAEGFGPGMARPERIALGAGLEGWVAAHQQAVFLDDLRGEPRFAAATREGLSRDGLRAVMCVPLVEGDSLLGTVLVGHARPRAFDARQRKTLLALAGILASAVSGGLRAQSSRGQMRDMTALLETARALAGSLEAGQVVGAALAGLLRVTSADHALLYWHDARDEVLHLQASVGPRFVALADATPMVGDAGSLAAWVARQRRARVIEPGDAEAAELAEVRAVGEMALLAAPLLFRDRLRGVAVVARRAPFASDELATALSLCGFAACALDNVERYRAARVEREKLAAIFDSASDGMAVVDDALTIVEANAAFAALVGQPGGAQARLVGRACCEVLQRTSVESCALCEGECLLARALREGEAIPHIECEFLMPRAAGELGNVSGPRTPNRFIDFSLTPMTGPEGQQVLLVGRDVTATRAMDQMKAHFLSMISHELRGPLQNINGYLDLLLSETEGGLSGEQGEFLRRARVGSEALTSLVDDLLLISRRDAGQFTLNLNEMSLVQPLRETLEELELMAASAGVALVSEMPPSLPLVCADELRIKQVLRNLLSNAIRFTPEGGRVTVGAAAHDGWLALRVRDTGAGIEEEHLERIFERFYQVKAAQGFARFQGQGLGLAIVRIIVEGHGGSVRVESALGEGSTFTVRLPLAPDEE